MKPFVKEVIQTRINGILSRRRLRSWVEGALQRERDVMAAGASAFLSDAGAHSMANVYDALGSGAGGETARHGSAPFLPSAAFAVVDCGRPDMPAVHVSPAYVRMVGYAREELVGRNLRLLQGELTDACVLPPPSKSPAGPRTRSHPCHETQWWPGGSNTRGQGWRRRQHRARKLSQGRCGARACAGDRGGAPAPGREAHGVTSLRALAQGRCLATRCT